MKPNTPRWITVLLWLLAAMYLANGIEMFFLPSVWFFRLVPGVPETGPFNAHLVAAAAYSVLKEQGELLPSRLRPEE